MNPSSSESGSSERLFPPGFLWGVATASYQVEGAVTEDGRGLSIWDTFSHTPGKVRRGDTGDIACDSYHRLEEDLDLLGRLGVRASRFSIAWPRIQPTGSGPVNEAGLDYYRRLVAGLHARGIEPVATVYHWDLPQPLEDAGGWPARDTAQRFADYAAIVGRELGDGISRWITINEPWVVADHGYRSGNHAPGRTDEAAAAAATHHLLLGHGLAVAALRAETTGQPEIGISLNLTPARHATPEAKVAAEEIEAESTRVFLDPLIAGTYPNGSVRASLLPADDLVHTGDMAIISTPLDFLGINYYHPVLVGLRDETDDLRLGEHRVPGHPGVVTIAPPDVPVTAMGWPVDAEGLYDLLLQLRDRVPQLPIYITENGMAAEDYVNPNGEVIDEERTSYLRGHLDAAARAIDAGVDLRGYFCWSFLDNFEWAEGFQKRFGLVYVDYGTQQRIPKASAAFYSAVTHTNSLPGS